MHSEGVRRCKGMLRKERVKKQRQLTFVFALLQRGIGIRVLLRYPSPLTQRGIGIGVIDEVKAKETERKTDLRFP